MEKKKLSEFMSLLKLEMIKQPEITFCQRVTRPQRARGEETGQGGMVSDGKTRHRWSWKNSIPASLKSSLVSEYGKDM